MKIVLKSKQIKTLSQTNIRVNSLINWLRNPSDEYATIEEYPGYVKMSDIDVKATEKLHQNHGPAPKK